MSKRGRVAKLKQPKEKPEYKEAPEVEELAHKVINQHHKHLVEAQIKFLFRTGKWQLRQKIVLGKAEKVGKKWQHLTGYDFVIVINRDAWFANVPEIRESLIDHELAHCSRGDDNKDGSLNWYKADHDVEDFTAVIKRRGLWTSELQRLEAASNEYRQQRITEQNGTGTEG